MITVKEARELSNKFELEKKFDQWVIQAIAKKQHSFKLEFSNYGKVECDCIVAYANSLGYKVKVDIVLFENDTEGIFKVSPNAAREIHHYEVKVSW